MGDDIQHQEMTKEEARMARLFQEGEKEGGSHQAGSPVQKTNLRRPSLRAKGSAEAALERGETEEEMIRRKTQELKAKAYQKKKKEEEPEWKKRQREKQEREAREAELRERQWAEKRARHAQEEAEREKARASGALASNSVDNDRDDLYRVIQMRKEREAQELNGNTSKPSTYDLEKAEMQAAIKARKEREAQELAGGGQSMSTYEREKADMDAAIRARKDREAQEFVAMTASPSKNSIDDSELARKEAARLRGKYWLATGDDDDDAPKAAAPQSTSSPAPGSPAVSSPRNDGSAASWSVDRVATWLGTIGLEDDKLSTVRKQFKDNDINGKALIALDKDDLQEMGITSMGVKKTILGSLQDLPK